MGGNKGDTMHPDLEGLMIVRGRKRRERVSSFIKTRSKVLGKYIYCIFILVLLRAESNIYKILKERVQMWIGGVIFDD